MQKILRKIEIKLFLSFFIFYLFFIHLVGWNEQTRLLSAISLVDENRLEIDSYANLTGDRIIYNNHYYSDKAPGSSFFLTPVYSLSKLFTNREYQPTGEDKVLLPQPQFNTTVYTDISPGTTFQLTSILGTILLSSLPGALIVLLIYLILLNITKDEKTSLITSIIFGLGTIIFSYSTVLMGNTFSLLLILSAFYLSYTKKNVSNKILLLSGMLLGFSIVIDYLSIIFASLFLVFQYRSIKRKILYIITGGLIGLSPLLFYNLVIFHSPFITVINLGDSKAINFIDPKISPCSYGKAYLSYCPTDEPSLFQSILVVSGIALRLLIYPYRGLFVYMPFLLLSFLGFKKLYRKNKELSVFIFLLFFGYLATNSSYFYWFGGGSFGPRYLLAVIPFLSIPLAYFIKNSKKSYLKFILVVLVSVSIFHMILGVSGNWEGVIIYYFEDYHLIRGEWYTKTFWSDTIATLNPLYEHYFPAFLDQGPITRLFDGIIQGEIPDIRDRPYSPNNIYLSNTPFGIVYIRSNIFGLFLLIIVIVVIWKDEINRLRLG